MPSKLPTSRASAVVRGRDVQLRRVWPPWHVAPWPPKKALATGVHACIPCRTATPPSPKPNCQAQSPSTVTLIIIRRQASDPRTCSHARCWLDAAVWAPRARSISLTARHARAARRTPRRSWLVGCAPCSVASGDPSRRHRHVPCRGAAHVRGVHTKAEKGALALCSASATRVCQPAVTNAHKRPAQ